MLVALHARLLAPGLATGELAPLVGLAAGGTFVIYGLDRLRDVRVDRGAWPERTAFVDRHRAALSVAVGICAAIAAACALQQPPAVWAICGGVGALGLAHVSEPIEPERLAAIGLATLGALAANLIGSNAAAGPSWALLAARVCAAAGVGFALGSGPNGAQALLLVPLAQLVALRSGVGGERARLWRIDGALAVGAALALGVLALH